MSNEWKLTHVIRPEDPAQWAYDLAYSVSALIYTARLALENETNADGGDTAEGRAAVSNTLEVAEALMAVVIDGSEDMTRRLNIGFLKKDADEPAGQTFPETPAGSQS